MQQITTLSKSGKIVYRIKSLPKSTFKMINRKKVIPFLGFPGGPPSVCKKSKIYSVKKLHVHVYTSVSDVISYNITKFKVQHFTITKSLRHSQILKPKK